MGCFAAQKTKKNIEGPSAQRGDDRDAPSSSPSASSPPLSAPRSFRKTVRAILHAQRFITRSGHSRGSTQPSHHAASRDTRLSEQGNWSPDWGTHSQPLPLPTPRLSPEPAAYVLPHPSDHGSAAMAPLNPHAKSALSASVGYGPLNSRVHPSDLQPLPLPKDLPGFPRGLKSYALDELASACQDFSSRAAIGDDGSCFAGAIKIGSGKGSKHQQQEVVVMRLHENLNLGLKEWLPELLAITHIHNSHLCKPLGFHCDDAKGERFLVYEKLQKGSLHDLIFEVSDATPLDWSARMKILQGAIQGLANVHEKFPEQTLYKDFRLSHIQVDGDNGAKLSGYWFVTGNHQTLQAQLPNNTSKARDNAYCAPETRRSGSITPKSNVWSLGVVMLEILCGRRNRDERTTKDDEALNLVKWARPYLREEDKLFLIMDPKLQGRFSSKGANVIASLALHCLQKDPTRRPSARAALEIVRAAQEKRRTSVSARRQLAATDISVPSSAPLLSSGGSRSLKFSTADRSMSPYGRSPTTFDLIQSPVLRPLSIPSRSQAD